MKHLSNIGNCWSLSFVGLELWCLTPLSTIFQLYHRGQFYWMKETRVPGENHRSAASQPQFQLVNAYMNIAYKLVLIMLYRVHLASVRFELTTLVVIGTDCTGNCKSNYHTITTTTAPFSNEIQQCRNNNKMIHLPNIGLGIYGV
jgi:hypothetical protein